MTVKCREVLFGVRPNWEVDGGCPVVPKTVFRVLSDVSSLNRGHVAHIRKWP